eukprot:TRINITY_DN4589_c0_g1_i2.p1 TRINITY_DN4589_c0_g1~~TRINITY_DN4589_c0_g1_i2.p1  ORF type:complete len:370 (+),score=42.05 TRINITY_DN4589_c0_g1_i2:107-1216(+)
MSEHKESLDLSSSSSSGGPKSSGSDKSENKLSITYNGEKVSFSPPNLAEQLRTWFEVPMGMAIFLKQETELCHEKILASQPPKGSWQLIGKQSRQSTTGMSPDVVASSESQARLQQAEPQSQSQQPVPPIVFIEKKPPAPSYEPPTSREELREEGSCSFHFVSRRHRWAIVASMSLAALLQIVCLSIAWHQATTTIRTSQTTATGTVDYHLLRVCSSNGCADNTANNPSGQATAALGILSLFAQVALVGVFFHSLRRPYSIPPTLAMLTGWLTALASILPIIEWIVYIGVKGASFSVTFSGVALTGNLAAGFWVCLTSSLISMVGIGSSFGRCCCCNPLMASNVDEELDLIADEIKRETVGNSAVTEAV